MTDTARWKSTVYVGGLPPQVTTTTLHEAFLPFGEIADVSLPRNENPQTSAAEPHRGFAYVEFEDAEDAREAVDNMDQAELFGRVIKCSAAKAPKSAAGGGGAGGGLGGRTAVWEQEGWLAEHAVSEEDRLAAEQAQNAKAEDPMQGLEALDVAGPKPA